MEFLYSYCGFCVFLLLGLSADLLVWVKGDYEVLVTVHSLVLLESRCAECYADDNSATPQNGLCCDGENMESCPSSCDVILNFCQLELELPQSTCRTVSFSSLLGFNLNTTEVYQYSETSPIGFPGLELINPVTYTGTSKWRGAQLNVLVNDRDQILDDLIDDFVIPINISAGSSITRNYTGRYNYIQLELTVKVMCVGNDTDENCVFDWCRFNSTNCNNGSCVNEVEGPRCECSSPFSGDYCTENDDCVSNDCQNGTCVDEDGGYRCECHPGFSGRFCEDNIDDCFGVTCSGRGECVDGVQNFSCNCDPGYSGAMCESGTISSLPLAAIIGGVAVGVVILIIVLALGLLLALTTKSTAVIQTTSTDNATDQLNSGQTSLHDSNLHTYEEVDSESTTVEMKQCAAYITQEELMDVNLAYGVNDETTTTTDLEMKQCTAYIAQKEVVLEVNPAYEEVKLK